ncbi:hypothetical protein [Stutzerimonas stutzeri]|uniref:hypothetical protein n=1 Tax=Stutzerimonas stutzeri TaxID=316 RepID=UPI00244B98E2|nr:hypothetical protein [Stutzerimonas stutzeri]MDH0424956.1 hypothetical protein [Stutzerimonas stutzeri]
MNIANSGLIEANERLQLLAEDSSQCPGRDYLRSRRSEPDLAEENGKPGGDVDWQWVKEIHDSFK